MARCSRPVAAPLPRWGGPLVAEGAFGPAGHAGVELDAAEFRKPETIR